METPLIISKELIKEELQVLVSVLEKNCFNNEIILTGIVKEGNSTSQSFLTDNKETILSYFNFKSEIAKEILEVK